MRAPTKHDKKRQGVTKDIYVNENLLFQNSNSSPNLKPNPNSNPNLNPCSSL